MVESPKYSDQLFTRFQGNQCLPKTDPLRSAANVNSRGRPGRPRAGLSLRVPWRPADDLYIVIEVSSLDDLTPRFKQTGFYKVTGLQVPDAGFLFESEQP